MTVGVGIVGCGLIGHKRAANLPSGSVLRACYDLDSGSAGMLAARSPGAVAASSLHDLLAREDVHFVVVATTHDMLVDVGAQAVTAGKHVLLEKPGAISPAPLRQLRELARARQRLVRVGFNHRFHEAFLRAREVVRSGEFGPLLYVRARYGHGGRLGYEQEWRADRARSGGGQLMDQGTHLIDLTHALFGPSELAFAELRSAFWPMSVEDNAFIALRPHGGGFAWLHASWTEWKNLFSYEIMLERAKVEVSGLGGSYGPERLTIHAMTPEMGPPPSSSWEQPPTDTSWRTELAEIVAEIAHESTGERIGATVDDAITTLELIEQAYRCARDHHPDTVADLAGRGRH